MYCQRPFIRLLSKLYCRGESLRRFGARILMYWPVYSGSVLRVSSHFSPCSEFGKKSTLWILFLCLSQGTIHAANDQQNYYRTFWNPQYHGKLLDYCLQDKTHCGKPVANQYCRVMGYDTSNQSTIAYNVGVTRYFATCKKCKAWNCNGFKRITCVAKHLHKPPRAYYFRARQFVYPRFNHYRIDWCYTSGKHCGERAAFSFCRRMGYSKAQHFEKESHVDATRAIGNQQLCFGDQCNGFKSITCYR